MLQCFKTYITPRTRKCITLVLSVLAVFAVTSIAHVVRTSPTAGLFHMDNIRAVIDLVLNDVLVAFVMLMAYQTSMRLKEKQEVAIASAAASIISAIAEDRIEIVLQPVYRVSNGTIVGFESLIRMNHPKYGYIRPDRMVASIAATDPVVAQRLTSFVINKTATYYKLLSSEGYDFQMSVNLHHHDLSDAAVITTITNALLNNDMPADRLTVEISNEIISKNVSSALRVLAGIESAEVKLSIDDFGTEISPFLHFRDFLVDEVKINNVITHRIDINHHSVETVRAIIHTAHSTGTYVTAKCIETSAELNKVKELGCDFVQGYIVAPPMTIEQARVWLKTQKTRAA